MTLLVNYRGGFAKLSDLGIITRDYVANFFFPVSVLLLRPSNRTGTADSLFDGA